MSLLHLFFPKYRIKPNKGYIYRITSTEVYPLSDIYYKDVVSTPINESYVRKSKESFAIFCITTNNDIIIYHSQDGKFNAYTPDIKFTKLAYIGYEQYMFLGLDDKGYLYWLHDDKDILEYERVTYRYGNKIRIDETGHQYWLPNEDKSMDVRFVRLYQRDKVYLITKDKQIYKVGRPNYYPTRKDDYELSYPDLAKSTAENDKYSTNAQFNKYVVNKYEMPNVKLSKILSVGHAPEGELLFDKFGYAWNLRKGEKYDVFPTDHTKDRNKILRKYYKIYENSYYIYYTFSVSVRRYYNIGKSTSFGPVRNAIDINNKYILDKDGKIYTHIGTGIDYMENITFLLNGYPISKLLRDDIGLSQTLINKEVKGEYRQYMGTTKEGKRCKKLTKGEYCSIHTPK